MSINIIPYLYTFSIFIVEYLCVKMSQDILSNLYSSISYNIWEVHEFQKILISKWLNLEIGTATTIFFVDSFLITDSIHPFL